MIKYPGFNELPIDQVYGIPNQFFNIYNMSVNKIQQFEISKQNHDITKPLFNINSTVPVELYVRPELNFSDYSVFIIVNKEYSKPTFLAKTRKDLIVNLYDTPNSYLLTIYEKDFNCNPYIIQQVIISKTDYNITYLLPFNNKI